MKNIINQNSNRIRAIIKNFLGETNEDIEQEVYLRTYKNLSKYEERNKFSQWICAITANICRDYLKSSTFKNNSNTCHDDQLIENIKTSKTPEAIYSSKERQKIVLKEVNKLPSKLKQALILYEFEDYSYDKISEKLKIPTGTVKSRINSARKILSEKLAFLLEDND